MQEQKKKQRLTCDLIIGLIFFHTYLIVSFSDLNFFC